MKILVPKSKSSRGCDPFRCSVFDCNKLHVNGKKKKWPFQKLKKTGYDCGRYYCGRVTIPGETSHYIPTSKEASS